ncbi:hypothetical protein DV735_g2920, partial [Chaetothyriales sp. CBS 134920]
MVPSLKSFYRASSPGPARGKQLSGGHRRSEPNDSSSPSHHPGECPRLAVPATVNLFDEESPPPSSTEQTSIAISIPLPWPKKFSRRASSVPASAGTRRWPDRAVSPEVHITSPIPAALVPTEPHQLVKTVSPSIANPKHTRPLILSPVNEGFGSPDSAGTTSDPSPITPIDQDSQADFTITTIATSLGSYSIAGSRPVLRQEAVRHVEAGAAIPSARDDRQLSRVSRYLDPPPVQHRNEPAPGLAATAFMRSPPMSAPYGYQWELRARSPSVPAVTSKASPVHPSYDHRRVPSDGSTHRANSACASRQTRATDDEGSISSEERHSRSSRGSWQKLPRTQKQQQAEFDTGGSGPRSPNTYATGPAFYRSVTDDYKKILRDPGDSGIITATAPLSRCGSAQGRAPVGLNLTRIYQPQQLKSQQKQKSEIDTMGEPGPEVDIVGDSDDNISPLHTLVPSGKELWG